MILDTLGNSTPKDNTEEGLEVESDASNTTENLWNQSSFQISTPKKLKCENYYVIYILNSSKNIDDETFCMTQFMIQGLPLSHSSRLR